MWLDLNISLFLIIKKYTKVLIDSEKTDIFADAINVVCYS